VDCYHKNEKLKKVMDLISLGFFSPEEPQLFRPIFDSLLNGGDRYMVMADFDSYVQCQKTLAEAYSKPDKWAKMSILNVANMAGSAQTAPFSSMPKISGASRRFRSSSTADRGFYSAPPAISPASFLLLQ